MPLLSGCLFLDVQYSQTIYPTPQEVMNRPPGPRPRSLLCAELALDAQPALDEDFCSRGATSFADPFRIPDVFPLAERLRQIWQAEAESPQPGAHCSLMDEFAEILGLRGIYEWWTPRSHSSPPA